MQIHGETGEGYVNDGCVKLREKGAQDRDRCDLPHQRVKPDGVAGVLRHKRLGPHRWSGLA